MALILNLELVTLNWKLETLNPLDIRLQTLDWLFTATRPWLFQGRSAAQQFPHGDDVDWKSVGDLAYFHNVEPLLYWMVSNTEIPTKIPEWLKQKWEQAYFGNFLRNEAYFELLKTLLSRCEKEGISIIVLKGPALIGRIYKDPALRTLSDLDILCSSIDLRRIVTITRNMGCKMMDVGDNPASAHHVAMVQAAGGAIGCNTKKLHRVSCQWQIPDDIIIKHISYYSQRFSTSISQLSGQD